MAGHMAHVLGPVDHDFDILQAQILNDGRQEARFLSHALDQRQRKRRAENLERQTGKSGPGAHIN